MRKQNNIKGQSKPKRPGRVLNQARRKTTYPKDSSFVDYSDDVLSQFDDDSDQSFVDEDTKYKRQRTSTEGDPPLPKPVQSQFCACELFIAMDPGTSGLKAAFSISYGHAKATRTAATRLLEKQNKAFHYQTCEFPRTQSYWPVELALKKNKETGEMEVLCGHEVAQELDEHGIAEDDALRYLKPGIYADDRAETYHRNRLQEQLVVLKSKFPQHDASLFTIEGIWVLYLRRAFARILEHVYKCEGDHIPWPKPVADQFGKLNFKLADHPQCHVQVALPVPAGASVETRMMAMEAAERAGLINCRLIDEPAAAMAYHAYKQFQLGKPQMLPTIVCDSGGGTCDVFLGVIDQGSGVQARNSTMRELVPSATEWCGSAFINKAFRELFVRELLRSGVDKMFFNISQSYDDFVNQIERRFEDKKRDWDGKKDLKFPVDSAIMRSLIPRLKNSDWLTFESGLLTVSARKIEEAHRGCLTTMFAKIDAQIEQYHALASHAADTASIDVICLVGGGVQNDYVRQKIIERYTDLSPEFGLPAGRGDQIQVVQPQSGTERLLTTVWGSLLLLFDKGFFNSWTARRGYCFAQDLDYDAAIHDYDRSFWHSHRGNRMIKAAARWVLRVGQQVKGSHTAWIRGIYSWDKNSEPGAGYTIEEPLFATDRQASCIDDIHVHDPQAEIVEVGRICFELDDDDVARMPTGKNDQKQLYIMTDYEVGIVLEGFEMEFYLRVPPTGNFDNCGFDTIRKSGKLVNARAGFSQIRPAKRY